MLNQNMTCQEITNEFFTDFTQVFNLERILRYQLQYNKERRWKGIAAFESHPRFFEFKSSKKKNNWLMVLSKPPMDRKYKGEANIGAYTYYQTDQGIRILKPMPVPGGGYSGMAVYEPQLFAEFNEKMNLGLTNPLEIIKRFFTLNDYAHIQITEKHDRKWSIAVTPEGLLFGEIEANGSWLVQKKFILPNEMEIEHMQVADELSVLLQTEIEQLLNEPQFNQAEYNFYADTATAINRR